MSALADRPSYCPRMCPRGGVPHCAAYCQEKGEPRQLRVPQQFRCVCLWRLDECLLACSQANRTGAKREWATFGALTK
jgi:hypothetical protein